MKKCFKCKLDKDISNFSKDRRANDGLNGACKTCISSYRDMFLKNNPEYHKKFYLDLSSIKSFNQSRNLMACLTVNGI